MLSPETIDATAHAAFTTYTTRTRYRPLEAALRAAPLEDAYRIQDALHRVMAEAGRGEIAGWKIALPSKAMQQMPGVDQPAAGAIFSKVVHASPARVDVAAYHHLGVEFEVAVRVHGPAGSPRAFRPSSWSRTATPTTRRSTHSPWSRRTPGTVASSSVRRSRNGAPSIWSVRSRAPGSTASRPARARRAMRWAIRSTRWRGSRTS